MSMPGALGSHGRFYAEEGPHSVLLSGDSIALCKGSRLRATAGFQGTGHRSKVEAAGETEESLCMETV